MVNPGHGRHIQLIKFSLLFFLSTKDMCHIKSAPTLARSLIASLKQESFEAHYKRYGGNE